MELLIAILFALKVFIGSGLTDEQIRERYPADYVHAKTVIDSHDYKVDPETGIIIIDEGGN